MGCVVGTKFAYFVFHVDPEKRLTQLQIRLIDVCFENKKSNETYQSLKSVSL